MSRAVLGALFAAVVAWQLVPRSIGRPAPSPTIAPAVRVTPAPPAKERPARFGGLTAQDLETGAALEVGDNDVRALHAELLAGKQRGIAREQLWARVEQEPGLDLRTRRVLRDWLFPEEAEGRRPAVRAGMGGSLLGKVTTAAPPDQRRSTRDAD